VGAIAGGVVGLGSAIRYRSASVRSKDGKELHEKFPTLYDNKGNRLRPTTKDERNQLRAMRHERIEAYYQMRSEKQLLKEHKLAVGGKQYRQEKREVREEIRTENMKNFIGSLAGKRMVSTVSGGLSKRKWFGLNRHANATPEKAEEIAERKVKKMKQIGDRYGVTAAATYATLTFTAPLMRNAWRRRNEWRTNAVLREPGSVGSGSPSKGGTGAGPGSSEGSAKGSGASEVLHNPKPDTGNSGAAGPSSSPRVKRMNQHLKDLNAKKEDLRNEVNEKTKRVAEGGAGAVWASFSLGFTGDKIRSVNSHIKKTNEYINKETEKKKRYNEIDNNIKEAETEKNAKKQHDEEIQRQKDWEKKELKKQPSEKEKAALKQEEGRLFKERQEKDRAYEAARDAKLLKEANAQDAKKAAEKPGLDAEFKKQHDEELQRQKDWTEKEIKKQPSPEEKAASAQKIEAMAKELREKEAAQNAARDAKMLKEMQEQAAKKAAEKPGADVESKKPPEEGPQGSNDQKPKGTERQKKKKKGEGSDDNKGA